MKKKVCVLAALLLSAFHLNASAAQGEMGTGTPSFGMYAESFGGGIYVWTLENALIGFPSGCTSLVVSPTTLGLTYFKIAIATMMTAKASGQRVRFYAHTSRDNGCGVDYLELVN